MGFRTSEGYAKIEGVLNCERGKIAEFESL
jgi:hypothetical protein